MSEHLAKVKILPPPHTMAHSADRLPDFDNEGRPSPAQWLGFDFQDREDVEPLQAPWLRKSGWVKYPILTSPDGKSSVVGEGEPVPYPDLDDSALVFDVETMVTAGPWPVMAAAASDKAWYSWLSPWLLRESPRKDHLIPFGSAPNTPSRLLIGHNVSYDRARILDEYSMQQSNIRFLDTQSLHVAVRGISSPQRPVWVQHRKNRAEKAARKLLEDQEIKEEQREELRRLLGGDDIDDAEFESLAKLGLDVDAWTGPSAGPSLTIPSDSSDDDDSDTPAQLQWQDISSTNSLAAVASLYCDIELAKDIRNEFVEATSRQQILDRLPELMNYCANDVAVTHQVYSQVLPSFRQTCPHPTTFAGVLGIGSPILPIDDEWLQYQKRCHEMYDAALAGVQSALVSLAETLRSEHATKPDQWYAQDPWLSQLDWSPKNERKQKPTLDEATAVPKWYKAYAQERAPSAIQIASAHILQLTLNGQPVIKSEGVWKARDEVLGGSPTSQSFLKTETGQGLQSGLGKQGDAILQAIRDKTDKKEISDMLRAAADTVLQQARTDPKVKERIPDLNWDLVVPLDPNASAEQGAATWPKWYWDLFKTATGKIDLTIRTKIAPLLLKISWRGCPLYHSREHGWTYLHRAKQNPDFSTQQKALEFQNEADEHLRQIVEQSTTEDPRLFYKVPHSSGDDANVGSPFSKPFMAYFDDGILRSDHPDEVGRKVSRDALDLNAQCSYWVGVRDRIANQMVVWDGESGSKMGFGRGASGMGSGPEEEARRKGLILPQIVSMGTVTRRAIEKTWLTASNAKKNRVGSELKSMVKAPPGWVIVGADVDSEELWICSVMGDAQFGLHGATAIGWMTLEGTKAAGTDLHSKTASILGTSRNQAKIFNYSRIYGAGIRHATQLMVKANPAMPREEAQKRAKELYAKTKGQNTHSKALFGRKFWYGGTESFVFNKLEAVALSESPRTPALDCGVTAALTKKFLPKAQFQNGQSGEDFMPSRINWVVQSSGVDYLHLLIASMSHLCKHYDIAARFMISVHDEVRYLAKEEDAHRAALALQIANLWTRAMFAYKLQMENLPEGVAWFAAVDVDKVLRKEVDDPCVTPSHPEPIPPGKAYGIADILKDTHHGSLHPDGRPTEPANGNVANLDLKAYPPYQPSDQSHRSYGDRGVLFLQAQTSDDIHEIRALEKRADALEGKSAKRAGTNKQGQSPSRPAQQSSARPTPSKPQRGQPAASRGMSTFIDQPASRARQEAEVPSSLKELLLAYPVRPNGYRTAIFWTTSHHKRHVKWGLYRALLRACPAEETDFRRNIKNRFHREKRRNKGSKIRALVQLAEERLALLQAVRNGDSAAKATLAAELAALQDRRSAYQKHFQEHQLQQALAPPPPTQTPERKPRLTGSYIAPSLYNHALPRLRPQPLKTSMIIRKRIISRRERIFHQLNLKELESAARSESKFMKELSQAVNKDLQQADENGGSADAGEKLGMRIGEEWHDGQEWQEALRMQRDILSQQFRNERDRASAKVPIKLLKTLKRVRRSKVEWRHRYNLAQVRKLNRGQLSAEEAQKWTVKARQLTSRRAKQKRQRVRQQQAQEELKAWEKEQAAVQEVVQRRKQTKWQ